MWNYPQKNNESIPGMICGEIFKFWFWKQLEVLMKKCHERFSRNSNMISRIHFYTNFFNVRINLCNFLEKKLGMLSRRNSFSRISEGMLLGNAVRISGSDFDVMLLYCWTIFWSTFWRNCTKHVLRNHSRTSYPRKRYIAQ